MSQLPKMPLVFVCLFSSLILRAQTTAEDKTLSPYFLVKSENSSTDQLPLKKTHALVNIAGVIADVAISQVYKNEGLSTLEAIYTFPASTRAAIYSMEMLIGDRKIIAQIEEKKKARADYEKAKEEGKRTSLLEQSRPNVFQMNVANILAGDEITVVLKYTEILVPEKGTYQFVYPTVVGPRYGGEVSDIASADNQFIATPYQKEGELPLYDFDIKVNINAGMPIQHIACATHKTDISYPTLSNARINLDPSEISGGNRDYILDYQLSGEQIESGLMLYKHEDENFFLWMVQPPKRVTLENIPPREYIFIVDVSGSMNGFPLSVSKQLMRNLISNLRPTDQFNILLFAGNSGLFNNESVNATSENVNQAINFIDKQYGGGGTNILAALQRALNLPRQKESVSRTFVIVTDGYIGVEEQAFELIREKANEANTFVFGIGSGVNRYLLEGIAHAGMGEPMVVTDSKFANEQAEKFREYIQQPVLSRINYKFNDFDAYDIIPETSPDVFAQRPIMILGKYKGTPDGTITLKGYTGNKTYKKTVDVSGIVPLESNVALRYLWARERIKQLDNYAQVDNNVATIKEVTELGLNYNLITAYTSFIAIDEQTIVNESGQIQTVKQALLLPQGVSNSAVGFDMAIDGITLCEVTVSNKKIKKTISISGPLSDNQKVNIQTFLQQNLIPQLNNCLAGANLRIEVKVDGQGNVYDIKIKNSNMETRIRRCIEETIMQINFSSIQHHTNWKFKLNL